MKTQRSRRDPVKERFWRETLRRQVESGQSVRAFCRERQLTESAFYFWRRELKQREGRNPLPPSRTSDAEKKRNVTSDTENEANVLFVPVVAESVAEATVSSIEMVLPSGAVLRLSGGGTDAVAEMIAALEARLC
jgi:transposase-like protein